MDKKNHPNLWKPASRHELRLIQLWEEKVLKYQLISALLIILLATVFYIFIVSGPISDGAPIWKAVLLYLLLLGYTVFLWWAVIYEDQRELWSVKLYTRTVTCIGHTEINTRYNTSYSLDIMDESGGILEQIKVPYVVMRAVRHQDTILAVTHDPRELRPQRLIPLKKPAKSSFW